MSRFEYLRARLEKLETENLRRTLVPREIADTKLIVNDQTLINFGGNDYLGLGTASAYQNRDTRIHRGSGASALVSGWTKDHALLADELAHFEGTEAAVVFPTGYAACSGTVATLAEQGDLVLSDELNHASLIDGCRLSRASRVIYPHRDCGFIRDTLQSSRGQFNRVWIVTDGVFSMDGHLAPLPDLVALAEKFDATLIVDEAHGTGVLGSHGSGVCELLDVKDEIPIRIGTLSKAIGSQGGFVAAPKLIVDYLINRCRTLIYSTSLAPTSVDAARQNLKRVIDEPQRRHHLHRMARQIRERLELICPEIERDVPIVPVLLGSDGIAIQAAQQLARQGFFVPAIRPPTVPVGTSRLRISVSAAHDIDTLNRLGDAVAELRTHGD